MSALASNARASIKPFSPAEPGGGGGCGRNLDVQSIGEVLHGGEGGGVVEAFGKRVIFLNHKYWKGGGAEISPGFWSPMTTKSMDYKQFGSDGIESNAAFSAVVYSIILKTLSKLLVHSLRCPHSHTVIV